MATRTRGLLTLAAGIILLLGSVELPLAEDFQPIRLELSRRIPVSALDRAPASPPLTLRGESNRGPAVYRQRVNGVVLIGASDGMGTGALISVRGDVITNHHVVEKAFRQKGEEYVAIWFKPAQGVRPAKDKFLIARVLRKDPQHDLALVRLVEPVPTGATVIPLAEALPDVGQEVYVIGHPQSYLWSFTQGIVSQIRPDHRWTYEDKIPRAATAIQTQAPVNPGNSGGPLFNEDGQIVGIVFGSATEGQGIFFAVAAQHVRELLP